MGQEDTQKATEQKMSRTSWQCEVVHCVRRVWGPDGAARYNRLKEYWDKSYESGMSPYVAVMDAWKAH